MRHAMFSVGLGAFLMYGGAALAQQGEAIAVIRFDGDEQVQDDSRTIADEPAAQEEPAGDAATAAPPASENKQPTDRRYRYYNRHWWYQTDDGQWLWRNGSRWVPYQPRGETRITKATAVAMQSQAAAPGDVGGEMPPAPGRTAQPVASPAFNQWFNAYRGFQTGRAQLRTAEAGQVEMATSAIGAEAEAEEWAEYGGIPRSQARRRRPGVGTAMPGSGSWFNSGSPFGIRYGYGSGFGYGGYGYDNPYGYGSRSGSGGAYGYGFAAFGSVGGQTGERLSSLIGGPSEEGGRLIGPEPPSFAAPSKLETAVGGTYGKAGAGARKLGGSAAEHGD
ncbi:MAG TPA: hypothetical protein VNH11_23790 [Pirellulales bacterium]|nr:hypothetical protein [Pirellulales bacterium]